ncbi:phosphatase 2C-like domain-containing protein [Cladochytrium replicatum]|nr:phosphatase 2C-like domain-containing protein [Cladochytrium replicatum]
MGQTLSEPVRDMETSSGGDDRLIYGASSVQGWRISMEDAHTTLLDIAPEVSDKTKENSVSPPSFAFFGVYDGHGGRSVSRFAGHNLHRIIAAQPECHTGDFAVAIRNAFLGTDIELRDPEADHDHQGQGSTAVVAIIANDRIVVGNAGDSRCVLSHAGKAVPLSNDHKPMDPTENQRIMDAGGFVQHGRVMGNLALSRAIGDFQFKRNDSLPAERQMVTADPDVEEHTFTDADEFLILACDGIWDVLTSQEAVDFVSEAICMHDGDLGLVCESLMNRCIADSADLSGIGCDNMTVVVVGLLRGEELGQPAKWLERIRRRVGASIPDSGIEMVPSHVNLDGERGDSDEHWEDGWHDKESVAS